MKTTNKNLPLDVTKLEKIKILKWRNVLVSTRFYFHFSFLFSLFRNYPEGEKRERNPFENWQKYFYSALSVLNWHSFKISRFHFGMLFGLIFFHFLCILSLQLNWNREKKDERDLISRIKIKLNQTKLNFQRNFAEKYCLIMKNWWEIFKRTITEFPSDFHVWLHENFMLIKGEKKK